MSGWDVNDGGVRGSGRTMWKGLSRGVAVARLAKDGRVGLSKSGIIEVDDHLKPSSCLLSTGYGGLLQLSGIGRPGGVVDVGGGHSAKA